MKFSIWGAGIRGERLLTILRNHEVLCFIDQDEKKCGTTMDGVPILSFREYKERKEHSIVIISLAGQHEINDIITKLCHSEINTYFVFAEGPDEYVHKNEIFPFLIDELLEELNIQKDVTLCLQGQNLYSLILYDYFAREMSYPCALIKDDWNKNMVELLQHEYDFIELDEARNKGKNILFTNRVQFEKRKPILEKNEYPFYTFSKLKRYENLSLKKLCYSTVSTKRCFICANGPSLSIQDLNTLYEQKEISFGVNRVYLVFSQVNWRPDYYVIDDGAVLEADTDEYLSIDVKYKLFSDASKMFWKNRKNEIERLGNIFKFHLTFDECYLSLPDFSDDIIHGVYGSASVINSCLQLACGMGYKEIYLIGADCSNAKEHFIQGYYGDKHKNIPNAFLNGFDIAFMGYRKAREYAESHGIKIFNATRGGKLEIFERVNFDDLF